MAEELSEFSAGEFQTVSELLASDGSLQALMVGLVLGLGLLASIYRWLGIWMRGRTFSYTRPHVARFTRSAMLAFFAIGLVTSINLYAQWSTGADLVNPTSDEARNICKDPKHNQHTCHWIHGFPADTHCTEYGRKIKT